MRQAILFILLSVSACAQSVSPAITPRSGSWFDAHAIDFAALSPTPPAAGSQRDRQDLNDVLLAQRTRTPSDVKQAQADDKEEDIFVFSSILGLGFNAAELPLTAALSQHLRAASAAVNPPLKLRFARPRPFVASAEVHPVCERTTSNSFPSGHAMVGVLEALTLTQIVPERSPQIYDRLDQYLQGRVICGVHYPSDVAASRSIAGSLFGLIAASPGFQSELASVRVEVRSHLGLSASFTNSVAKQNYLSNNTVLIVRHAEKPAEDSRQTGLTDIGRHRAEAYRRYFLPFKQNGSSLRVTALYAGADSAGSVRPRLTLEPLSQETGIPLNTTVSTKEPEALVELLRTHPHGTAPLICWRHGQIPALLIKLGATPNTLLPGGKWPDDVYDWVLVLHLDDQGKIQAQELVHESLAL